MAGKEGKGNDTTALEGRDGPLLAPEAGRRNDRTEKEQDLEVVKQVSDLFGKLNLTAKEKETLVLEDIEDSDLAEVNHSVIGKVLAPNALQLQTIISAMRPAWGNPKGLVVRMVDDNLFIAEFESELDKTRVLDGSPWYIGRQPVGRQVVILQDFNYDLRPSDVKFDELAIWVNILNLPFGLRNEKWGFELARMIGKKVLKVDVDKQKRAVGKDLRARIIIPLNEPLPRGVSVFSSRRQRKEWYDVVYEKVPFFCFSCGIIGHSEIECPTPATRDENGCLPYSEKLRASEDRRLKNQVEWFGQGGSTYRRSISLDVMGSSDPKKFNAKWSDDSDRNCRKEDRDGVGIKEYSPSRNQVFNAATRCLDGTILEGPLADDKQSAQTKKRKSDDGLMKDKLEEDEEQTMDVVEESSMALVPVSPGGTFLQKG
ncbi:unnamed protein product [Urochloa decumbens]|uniref:CCHC-type domain-containing protein n=1 Tax=Urochloa decumbens TaxID=240449 RepID=A0ABC9G0Z9_9POAL